MAKIKMDFKGMSSVMETIDKMGLSVHDAAEKALKESADLVTNQVKQELPRYKVNTGEMKDSLYENQKVIWIGETASISAGFNQKDTMHATYMMITGTPYMFPDKKLYDAIYGAKTKKAIKEIQERALMEVIEGGQK